MNTPPNRRYVVARDYADFKKYVDHEADPRMLHVWVSGPNVLAGRNYTPDQIVWLGGWEKHREADRIQEQIKLRLRLNGASA